MDIEFLFAYDDGTWGTEVLTVPEDTFASGYTREEAVVWAEMYCLGFYEDRMKSVVCVQVYHVV